MKKIRTLSVVGTSVALILSMTPIMAAVAPGSTFSGSASCGYYEGAVRVTGSNATVTSADDFCNRGGSVSASARAGKSGTSSITFTIIDATSLKDPANPKLVGNVRIGSRSVTISSGNTGGSSGGNSGGNSGSSSGSSGNTGNSGNKPNNTKPNESGNKTNNSNKDDTPEKEKSKDSSLASLSVSKGSLSPAFSSKETAYKISLPADVEELTVKATPKDAKATVSGTGVKKLKPGNNTIEVNVTAENGTSTTYRIKAYVDEKPIAYVMYNGTKLGVSRNSEKAPTLSKLFTKTSMKIDGKTVDAWNSKSLNITLLYLQSDKGNNYYMYDEAKNEATSVYEPMGILGLNIARIDIPQTLQKKEGMEFTTVKVDDKEFQGWTFKDSTMKDFALLYVMDDNGEKVYYQYDKIGNTLQRYSGAASITQSTYEKTLKDLKDKDDSLSTYKMITYGLGGLSIVLLIVSIFLGIRKKKGKRYDKVGFNTNVSKDVTVESEGLQRMHKED